MMLTAATKSELLNLARFTLDQVFSPSSARFSYSNDPILLEKRGVFVTLKREGELRGCIGSLLPMDSVYESVEAMAWKAAFADPRFTPLTDDEWPLIQIEILVLSPMIVVTDMNEIQIGRDGLLLRKEEGSGVLLPKVAVEWKWNSAEFLAQLFRKAGLRGNHWEVGELFRFEAEEFSER